jgi:WD40 repeat protein
VVTALEGSEDTVVALAFSPDGRLLATGSRDGSVRSWEAATGKPVAKLEGHEDRLLEGVTALAFSPDGRLLASASDDKSARLWEVSTGKAIAALRHESFVSNLAFSPDGRLLVTSSDDKSARLWETATGEAVATLRDHKDGVTHLAFSPNGLLLATGSWDKTARLWSLFPSTQALVDHVKQTIHRCLTPAQRRSFHLQEAVPRWCFERKLWPYNNNDGMYPSPSLDERLVAIYDVIVGWLGTRRAVAN